MLFEFVLHVAVKASKRNVFNSTKGISITTIFPIARLHGTISPELTEIWEMRCHAVERQKESQSPPLYEKVLFFHTYIDLNWSSWLIVPDVQLQLRQSLIDGGHETFDAFHNSHNENENHAYDSGIPDLGEPEFDDFPENMSMDEDVPVHNGKVRQTSKKIVLYVSTMKLD